MYSHDNNTAAPTTPAPVAAHRPSQEHLDTAPAVRRSQEHLAAPHPHPHSHLELQSTFVDPITIEKLNLDEKYRNEKGYSAEHPAPATELLEAEEARRRYEAKPVFGKRPMKTFLIHFGLWLLLTGFTIALWTLGKEKDGSLKDGYAFWTVVWAFITLRFIAQHVSISKILFNPLSKVWNATAVPATRNIPKNFLFGGILVATLACMLISALFTSSDESTRGERVQSWAGVIFILALAAASSRNKRAINIQTVAVGILLQFLFALLVLKWETGTNIFDWFSKFIRTFLEYAYDGLSFLVWGLEKNTFAVNVLPAIIFFCSFIQVVYYWGGMQYLVQTLGRVMMTLMDTSGAESVVAAASPFVGQVENALLVLPFIEYMTKSELHAVMCCGFATISGSVLAGYAAIVGDVRLILTACIMSIPASLVLTKLRYPEEEESLTKGKVSVPPTKEKDVNFLHAAGNGAATGAQLVILISATLLALIALYTAANDLVGWCFDMLNIHRPIEDPTIKHPDWVSIAFILSYPFSIMAWFLGISWEQARTAGEIMAEKMVVNEFFAYEHLSKLNKTKVINARTFHVLAFALCGFANIGSIGIQVSALGAISPSRKQELAQLAVSAMLLGTMSTWLTAAVAGTLL